MAERDFAERMIDQSTQSYPSIREPLGAESHRAAFLIKAMLLDGSSR